MAKRGNIAAELKLRGRIQIARFFLGVGERFGNVLAKFFCFVRR